MIYFVLKTVIPKLTPASLSETGNIIAKILNFALKESPILIALVSAVIIYFVALILLKGINEYDLSMIPYGDKIYRLLKKFGIYKD